MRGIAASSITRYRLGFLSGRMDDDYILMHVLNYICTCGRLAAGAGSRTG
jgi:hypothetical protein